MQPVTTANGEEQTPLNFSHLFDQVPFAVAVLKGRSLIVEYINQYNLEIWQQSKDTTLGRPLFEVRPDLQDTAEQLYTKAFEMRQRVTANEIPFQILHNGKKEIRYFNTIIDPLFDAAGLMIGQVTTTTEVTEQVLIRRKAEEAEAALMQTRNESEKMKRLYEGVIGSTPDLVYIFSLDYRFIYANPALLAMWGERWETAIGKGLRELGYEEWHAQMHEQEIDTVVATKKTIRGTVSFPHAELGKRIYDYIFAPVINEQGEVEAVAGTTRDISDIKVAENALKKSEQHLELLSNAVPAMIFYLDAQQRYLSYNETFCQWFDVDMDEAVGKTVRQFIGEKAYQAVLPHLQVAYAGEQERYEMKAPTKIGEDKWLSIVYTPHKDDEGKVLGVIVLATDITESKQTEIVLRESDERFQNLIKNATVGVVLLTGAEMKVEIVNKAYGRLIDRSPEELLGQELFHVIPDAESYYRPMLDNVLSTGQSTYLYDSPYSIKKDGRTIEGFLNVVYQPYRNTDGIITGILALCQDVSTQVLAQRSIRESEERFRTLTETLPQLVWMTDAKGEQQYASAKWKEYTGVEPVGLQTWVTIVHPDDLNSISKIWMDSLATGNSYRHEVRLKSNKGKYNWHYGQGEPIRNEEGKVIKWIGSFTNIQTQKDISEELEKLVAERTSELAKANKELSRSNEDLQQFAHVASHDLKEPVRKVLNFSSRLKYEFESTLPAKANSYLSKIESSAFRMYSMIDGVLLYSSLNALEQTKELIDLNELMESIEADLEIAISEKNASIQYKDLPTIEGSSILFYQLFYNLIKNSLKFAQTSITPLIGIIALPASLEEIQSHSLVPEKSYIKVQLQDNGIGFSNQDAEKIFGTSTRLHSRDKYEGTGLGLALCKKIVERHGGVIYAKGEEGKGACFTILLPE